MFMVFNYSDIVMMSMVDSNYAEVARYETVSGTLIPVRLSPLPISSTNPMIISMMTMTHMMVSSVMIMVMNVGMSMILTRMSHWDCGGCINWSTTVTSTYTLLDYHVRRAVMMVVMIVSSINWFYCKNRDYGKDKSC